MGSWEPSPEIHAQALRFITRLSEEQRTDWEERAAIMEYDGGPSREAAEVLAAREIRSSIIDRMQQLGQQMEAG